MCLFGWAHKHLAARLSDRIGADVEIFCVCIELKIMFVEDLEGYLYSLCRVARIRHVCRGGERSKSWEVVDGRCASRKGEG
jgi:hypothetical protein